MVLSPGAGIANAAGGVPSLSPACPAFCFPFCPPSPKGKDIPPTPFPGGEGRPRLFHARGSAPCIPGAEPARHWERGRTTHPAGGLPPALPVDLATVVLAGGLIFLVACRPCLLLSFLPPSPEGKDRPSGRGARTCAVGKSARTGVCVAGRTCNNRHPLLTIAAEYGTITHRKNPKRGGIR